MSDQMPPVPPPRVQKPMGDVETVKAWLALGFQFADQVECMKLFNTAVQFTAPGVPSHALPMVAAHGMLAARVSEVVDRLAPPREGATPAEIIAELPDWAREVLTAVGVIAPPETEEPSAEDDLVARAMRSNLVLAR